MSAEGLVSAIREAPGDDTHRLVYADWLEEHGDADRAEFIRAPCRLAALGEYDEERDDLEVRERELLARHERAWVGELPVGVEGWRFRRGFLDELTLPARAFSQRLRAAGKKAKVALVAVARQLVVLANAVLRAGRPRGPDLCVAA